MHLPTRALFLLFISFLLISNDVQGQTVNLMFYFQTDNPQACQAAKAIGDILSASSSSTGSATVTIFWQRSATYCASTSVGGISAYSGARIFRVSSGNLTQLADLGTVDATSSSTFSSFVSTALSGLPSTITSHSIVFSGTGSYFYFGTQESQSSPQNAGWLYPNLAAAVASAASLLPTSTFQNVFFDAPYAVSLETSQAFASAGGVTFLLGYQSIQQPLSSYATLLNLGTTSTTTFLTSVYTSIMATSGGFASSHISVSGVTLSLISPVTTAHNTLARGLKLFPQRLFSELRRSLIHTDLSPYPVTASSVVDLGYIGTWLSSERAHPFTAVINSDLAVALSNAVSAAVIYHQEGPGLTGSTGLNVFFPLTNSTQYFIDTTTLYLPNYGNLHYDWFSFILQYLYAVHTNFLFTDPTISYVNSEYTLSVVTENDVVVDSNLLSSVTTAGTNVLINGMLPTPLMINRSTDPVNGRLTQIFDTNIWVISGSSGNFYPFVQEIYSGVYAASFIVGSNNLLLKGFFTASNPTINYFYTSSENTAVSFYPLASGTVLTYAGTKPFDLSTATWGDSEVQTAQYSFTTTASTVTLSSTTCAQSGDTCYVFLQTRNVMDQFGSVGWTITPSSPSTPTYITAAGPTPPVSNVSTPFNVRFTYDLKKSLTAFTITVKRPSAYLSVVSAVTITSGTFTGAPALRHTNTNARTLCSYSTAGVLSCTLPSLTSNSTVIKFKLAGQITSPPTLVVSVGSVTKTVTATSR